MHLCDNTGILLCSNCILCLISFSISYIRKYYLEGNPYIHRRPSIGHIYWYVERTYKCAPKEQLQMCTKSTPNLHLHICNRTCQKLTHRCATRAHLPRRAYTEAWKPKAPLDQWRRVDNIQVHQKRIYRCVVGAHQTRTYPSFALTGAL